jgi:hypothetical protein
MTRPPIHEPPPPPVVAALLRAGLSLGTATAMEPWKAIEVLELLRTSIRIEQLEPIAQPRGTI